MNFLALFSLFVSLFLPSLTSAFVVSPLTNPALLSRSSVNVPTVIATNTALLADKKKKGGLDETVRTKLVAESIDPWRTLRVFLYVSAGSGALIGGLITLTGAAAVMSGAKEGDMNVEGLNLAIDFGAVAIFALLTKYDLQKQAELSDRVEEGMEEKKDIKKRTKGMKDREIELGTLRLDIQVSADGATNSASVKELQAGARQHMIIVVGPKKACRDALVGANLLKMDFAMSNILVVPVETGVDAAEMQSRPEGGFGDKPIYERQAYVARPTGDGWDAYIKAELDDALEQNGEKEIEEGIVIVVSSTGKIIRRGVGKVPWRQMVEQLDKTVGGGREKEPSWMIGMEDE